MELRRFTDRGLELFRRYLAALRAGSLEAPPAQLLDGAEFSRAARGGGDMEPRVFASRLEAARYLHEVLPAEAEEGLEADVHLWAWLSLYYFDQLSPPLADGRRKPGRDYRLIPEPGFRHGHRHLLGGAYLVYTVHGWGEELSPLLLFTPLNVESKFHHELAARQNLIANRGVLEAAHLLYFDRERGRPKSGALIKGCPGGLHRFIDLIQQLDLTYDLFSMKGTEMVRLLPPEFRPWLQR